MNRYRWHAAARRTLADSWANLAAAPLRTALALLGIVIGTAAVVALINISANAAHQSRLQFAAMGADTVLLRAEPATAATFARALPDIHGVAGPAATAVIRMAGNQARFHTLALDAVIIGSDAALQDAARLSVASGRFLSRFDGDVNVAILGAGMAGRFAALGLPLRVGDMVALHGYRYRVVGILQPTTQNPLLSIDFNNVIIVPQESLVRVSGEVAPLSILVKLAPGADPVTVAGQLATIVERRYGAGLFQVSTAQQLLEGMEQQQHLFGYLIMGVGVVAAAVGGVGIMNVMLTSVLERRKEIGLRMAIGASPERIAGQFLVETALLAALGAVAGLLLGHVIAYTVALLAQWQHVVAWSALPAAAGMSLAVAFGAGLYPALRAARMDPAQALRSD